MRLLVLEPYFDGSHRAFLEGWRRRSVHDWTLLTLPARKWKWRMRHSALTFAGELEERVANGEVWDAIFATDMLNVAEFRALAPPSIRGLPTVLYFHENQLTYPARFPKERDLQFGMTNILSSLAAEEVWFNSEFHRQDFLGAIPHLFRKMPDFRPHGVVERILERSQVRSPGVDWVDPVEPFSGPQLRIAWAARWEHDKAPATLFRALGRLEESGLDFRLSVFGQHFAEVPPEFEAARARFEDRLDHWGFVPSVEQYRALLGGNDLFVSTAEHEFFGLATVEACSLGVAPLLPQRLSYPELLSAMAPDLRRVSYYEGTEEALVDALRHLAGGLTELRSPGRRRAAREAVRRYRWSASAERLDQGLDGVRAVDERA